MRTIYTSERGCGQRVSTGVYLVSEPSPNGILPLWVSLHPPIPCEDHLHRGPVLVDGDRILERAPEEAWFTGTSADHRFKLSADEWAIQEFGMTTTMRLRIGECVGLTGVDEAMEHLIKTVKYNPVYYKDTMTGLIYSGIADIPQILPHFSKFSWFMQEFHKEYGAKELVAATAAVWRMANALSPGQREEFIPHLMRLLIIFNLRKDALAMKKRFLK